MATKLPPSKGSKILMGYRTGIILLAIIILGLDSATVHLLDMLMNPRFRGFHGMIMFKGDYTILVVPDVFTIVFFALLVFRPQGFAPLRKLSSRILTSCRVFFSLGLTALILCGPAMELEVVLRVKSEFLNETPADELDRAHKDFKDFFFCVGYRVDPDNDLTRTNQQYCQVGRARWFMGFFLGVLVFGELVLSYWARNFKVQQERDRKLQPETGEYKTMTESEA
ncbi:hypothetical protein BGZ68_004876 [Mortierella alpina]|nr:hypothetical protein BGZ68_004876 [Mortierella alpina]